VAFPQQAVQVAADWQQVPSQVLANADGAEPAGAGDDAQAAVASNPTASAANRIIFFMVFFFLVEGLVCQQQPRLPLTNCEFLGAEQ
jgi:hypothetical protein